MFTLGARSEQAMEALTTKKTSNSRGDLPASHVKFVVGTGKLLSHKYPLE